MARRYRRSAASLAFDVANYTFLVVLSFAFIYPILLMLSMSFSDSRVMGFAPPKLLPQGFTAEAYTTLLDSTKVLRYYANTIYYAGVGTVILLVFTSMIGYALTYRSFGGNKPVTVYLVITMFFSGGLIPYYLVVRNLGLINTVWAMVLPGAIAAWNVMIFRTFFNTIPPSLKESAFMDGAGHLRILFSVILPLSKPLLATFTLFSVVRYWNDWFQAVIFLREENRFPIQLFLRSLVVALDHWWWEILVPDAEKELITTRQLKAAAVMITITPILCIYPFLQKYFAKGILVGSIKG
jgi:putative aldouronate transport system permease protein